MARPTIGLDIGTSAVRATEIRGSDPATVTRFAQLSLPARAVADGEILDAGTVSAVIRDLWRRGEFRSRRVAIAVANQKVVVRQLDLPEMDEADLGGALRYQVQDYIPIPVEEALLDALILDRSTDDTGAPIMRVLTVAAYKEMIDAFVAVVDGAGLEPVSVDLGPLAAVPALAQPKTPLTGERTAEAIVDIGASVTSVVVHESGRPRFVRILQSGGSDITEGLVTELSLDPEEAEARKIAMGLGGSDGDEATAVIARRFGSFMDEVRRSVEFYSQQKDAVGVARVLLTGGGSLLAGITEQLAGSTGLTVERADLFARVQVGDLGLTDEQLQQAGAVAAVSFGLAMEDA